MCIRDRFGVGSPDQWVTRAKAGPGGGTRPQNEIGKRRLAGLGDSVPESGKPPFPYFVLRAGPASRTGFCSSHPLVRTTHTKPVSYTHLRAHETVLDLVCRLLL